jgi:uncharacterized protein
MQLKVVLDTNVFISAAILGRVCEDVVQTCRFSNIEVFISKEIISEIKNKLLEKFQWNEEQVGIFLESILEFCNIEEVIEKISFIKDDPDDDKILETAVSGKCDFIISGDKHLLRLRTYEEIKILNPSDFLLLVKG